MEHKINYRLVIFAFILCAGMSFQTLYGQDTNSNTDSINPPYIARTSNFMAVLFHLNAEEAQKLLPASVKVKSDEQGMASGGLEIYSTDQVFGIPAYTIAFITLQVQNRESIDGNWVIWGMVDNEPALNIFKNNFNFPYTLGNKMTIDTKEAMNLADIQNNKGEGLKLILSEDNDNPVAAEGLATVLSKSENGKILHTEIPWVAKGNMAKIESFEIKAGENDILNVLKGAKPFYSQVSSNAFSYTKPFIK